jgi:hypothetical protein
MKRCVFNMAWIGQCKEEAAGSACCAKHNLKCASCGAPATHDCDETGQFVCGAPLCDNCEHAIFTDGTNGGVGFNQQKLPSELTSRHILRSAQVFQPWFSREMEAK